MSPQRASPFNSAQIGRWIGPRPIPTRQDGFAWEAKTRSCWNLSLTIGIPFSRWGARPFVQSPMPGDREQPFAQPGKNRRQRRNFSGPGDADHGSPSTPGRGPKRPKLPAIRPGNLRFSGTPIAPSRWMPGRDGGDSEVEGDASGPRELGSQMNQPPYPRPGATVLARGVEAGKSRFTWPPRQSSWKCAGVGEYPNARAERPKRVISAGNVRCWSTVLRMRRGLLIRRFCAATAI